MLFDPASPSEDSVLKNEICEDSEVNLGLVPVSDINPALIRGIAERTLEDPDVGCHAFSKRYGTGSLLNHLSEIVDEQPMQTEYVPYGQEWGYVDKGNSGDRVLDHVKNVHLGEQGNPGEFIKSLKRYGFVDWRLRVEVPLNDKLGLVVPEPVLLVNNALHLPGGDERLKAYANLVSISGGLELPFVVHRLAQRSEESFLRIIDNRQLDRLLEQDVRIGRRNLGLLRAALGRVTCSIKVLRDDFLRKGSSLEPFLDMGKMDILLERTKCPGSRLDLRNYRDKVLYVTGGKVVTFLDTGLAKKKAALTVNGNTAEEVQSILAEDPAEEARLLTSVVPRFLTVYLSGEKHVQ